MVLPPVNSSEYAIMVWIIVEVVVLFFVIKMNNTKKIDPKLLSTIGLSIVVFGTFFYLIFGIAIFTINEVDTICQNSVFSSETLIEDIENKLLEDKLLDCFTKNNDKKWSFFELSIIMSMIIVFGSVLQAISYRR